MCKGEWIEYPDTIESLRPVLKDHEDNFLPGCGGSGDAVHQKWSCYPAGDFNRASGKEKVPSVAFECVTNNKCKIL